MPPPLLFDTAGFDASNVLITREEIYEQLPHRYEFMQLDGIVHIDLEAGEAAAVRNVRDNEFWVKGHIPGRPLFPGVLMMESAAHLASFVTSRIVDLKGKFLGFGGVDKFKFREGVTPGSRILILSKLLQARPRRIICATQGLVGDRIVFEGQITGMPF